RTSFEDSRERVGGLKDAAPALGGVIAVMWRGHDRLGFFMPGLMSKVRMPLCFAPYLAQCHQPRTYISGISIKRTAACELRWDRLRAHPEGAIAAM
ncbi:unnamed protein product, partial [Symbiodinium pilosum]